MAVDAPSTRLIGASQSSDQHIYHCPDPASTQPAAISRPAPGLWNGLRFFGAAAISDGSPRRGVWGESPCRGGGEGALVRSEIL
jgi:hypothetical protein